MTAPLLSLLIALPLAGALALQFVGDDRRARHVALVFAGLTLALSLGVAFTFARSQGAELVELGPVLPGLGARWHLGVDGLAAPFLPLAALLAVAVLLGAPRSRMGRVSSRTVLLTLSTTLGVYCALDLLLLSAFWIASLVPAAFELSRDPRGETTHRLARMFDSYLVLGSLPIVAASAIIAWTRAGAGVVRPLDLTAGAPVPASAQHLVFVLLALAVLIRKAIVPFHSWLPVLLERGPLGIAMMIAGTHLGAFLLARLVVPLLPDAARADLPLLADLALLSALYTAFVALSQHDLRRALGFVITSKLGLVLAGLAEVDRQSVHGAMLQMIALAVAATGLMVIAAGLEARCGTLDMRKLGGLSSRFPRMATGFFLLSLAAIGLPGMLQYVAEDLLLHGLLDSHPVVATMLLAVTVLNGITLLRAFFTTFYGEPRGIGAVGPSTRDLLPREWIVVGGAVVLLLATGLAPEPLIDVRERAVRALAIADSGAADHGAPAVRPEHH